MTAGRLGKSKSLAFVQTSAPFSNFQYVQKTFPNQEYPAIRRLFSLARKDNRGRTLVIEDIDPAGAVADEIAEIKEFCPEYVCTGLKRLTFLSKLCESEDCLAAIENNDILGFAILKCDAALKCDAFPQGFERWHVFESVFRKYDHHHNCVPGEANYRGLCGNRPFQIAGVMYCQQNTLNKACAQVALRSLLSRMFPERDLFYSEMNDVAREIDSTPFCPGRGLTSTQIRAILDFYGVKYDDIDYEAVPNFDIPYSKWLYGGIENGYGGLLGFELEGADAGGDKHIVPVYGHTFNQDSWVPRAHVAYFHVGDHTRYISSEEWMGSFIGHDDNFGSNFCIPRRLFSTAQVKYVVALRPDHTEYGAVYAEAIGVDFLYTAMKEFQSQQSSSENNLYWMRQLMMHVAAQDVILRAVYMTSACYAEHLAQCTDWEGNQVDLSLTEMLKLALPEHLWVVEISIPELFPTNYSKLGDLLLDASVAPTSPEFPQATLILARFPGVFLIADRESEGAVGFKRGPSMIQSHVSVYRSP